MIFYLRSKFQFNLTILGAVRSPKPPKMGQFMDAASPQNHLNIYNLGTTKAIEMKLTTIMYRHETFHLV